MALWDTGRNPELTARINAQFDAAIWPERKRALNIDKAHGKHPQPERKVNEQIAAMKFDGKLYRNNRGAVSLGNGNFMRYGVGPNGAGDWIGWRSVTITPAMVGRRVALFANIEAKSPGRNADPDQSAFIDYVLAAGGIAGVAHSATEALAIIQGDP